MSRFDPVAPVDSELIFRGDRSRTTRLAREDPETRVLLHAFLLTLFGVVLVRTAWLGDDAYITFRTVDNFVSGYGLRWNLAERVQTFTHPLWVLVLSVPYFFTREAYFTSLVTTMALSLCAMAVLLARIASSARTALVAGALLVLSKAFVEYSTSGLENPLTHLLLVLFLAAYWKAEQEPRTSRWMWIAAGLLMLNRLDLAVLIAPALAVRAFQHGRRGLVAIAAGLAPVVAWELFSLVYYGFLFPNTAYAKLPTGTSARELAVQGCLYLLSAADDPVTLVSIAASVIVCLRARRRAWPLAAGICLYLLYIVRIGGDFMAGRFLAAPLVCAVAVFAHEKWELPDRAIAAALAGLAIVGVFGTVRPPLTSGAGSFILSAPEGLSLSGIADERAFYYRYTGLLRWSRQQPLPYNAEVLRGRELRASPEVLAYANVGFVGYFAGPASHIVDTWALTDPLLARLPAKPGWRVGHYERAVPDGYLESIRTGRNAIADPAVAMLYERIKTITAGPLWSRRRWRAILSMNAGLLLD
jgi:arabinofuranosyltransferase